MGLRVDRSRTEGVDEQPVVGRLPDGVDVHVDRYVEEHDEEGFLAPEGPRERGRILRFEYEGEPVGTFGAAHLDADAEPVEGWHVCDPHSVPTPSEVRRAATEYGGDPPRGIHDAEVVHVPAERRGAQSRLRDYFNDPSRRFRDDRPDFGAKRSRVTRREERETKNHDMVDGLAKALDIDYDPEESGDPEDEGRDYPLRLYDASTYRKDPADEEETTDRDRKPPSPLTPFRNPRRVARGVVTAPRRFADLVRESTKPTHRNAVVVESDEGSLLWAERGVNAVELAAGLGRPEEPEEVERIVGTVGANAERVAETLLEAERSDDLEVPVEVDAAAIERGLEEGVVTDDRETDERIVDEDLKREAGEAVDQGPEASTELDPAE